MPGHPRGRGRGGERDDVGAVPREAARSRDHELLVLLGGHPARGDGSGGLDVGEVEHDGELQGLRNQNMGLLNPHSLICTHTANKVVHH